jgi:hypothetical protein
MWSARPLLNAQSCWCGCYPLLLVETQAAGEANAAVIDVGSRDPSDCTSIFISGRTLKKKVLLKKGKGLHQQHLSLQQQATYKIYHFIAHTSYLILHTPAARVIQDVNPSDVKSYRDGVKRKAVCFLCVFQCM